ncbi:MAG: hypothetical protein V4726_18305 [Verrucomicrobiota bacterium]
MAYCLQAIIGAQQVLLRHGTEFQHAAVVMLAQGMAIIPLTDALYGEIGVGGEVDHFYKLSAHVEEWAERISHMAPVAYIEADFFGGAGDQSAIAWVDGERIIGPLHTDNAINEILHFLGARVNSPLDEFDSVGLGRHRDTASWTDEKAG